MEIEDNNDSKEKLDISQKIKLPLTSNREKKELAALTSPNFFLKKKLEIQAIHQKTKSFNDKLRLGILKKMGKKKVGYEKRIYGSLYDQIHKSVKNINRQIDSAKKILYPKKNKKKNSNNFYSTLIDKTKKFKFNENNNENNFQFSIRKPSLFLTNSPRKQTEHFLTEMNSYKNVKKLTLNNFVINNNNNLENKIENNIEIFEYNKKNNDKKTKEISRDYSKSCKKSRIGSDLPENSNKNVFNLNDITSTNTNNNINNNQRHKTLYVEYDPNWYQKNKFVRIRLSKVIIENPTLQPKLINDELALLFESIKTIQTDYLTDKNLFSLYCKQGSYSQKSMNILLEESIGLMREISYYLLGNYNKIIGRFISKPLPRITKKKLKLVKDEKKEFLPNINLLSDGYLFLKVCYDTYKIILTHRENYFLKYEHFNVLYQYIERARFNISKICLDLNNMFVDNTKDDKKIINDYINKMKTSDRRRKIQNEIQNKKIRAQSNSYKNSEIKNFNNKKLNKIKTKLDCHQKFSSFQTGINPFNYKGPKKLKLSEENLTLMRIKKALGPKTSRENIPSVKVQQFDINSRLINQLLNYACKEFKKKVISERIRQKFADN